MAITRTPHAGLLPKQRGGLGRLPALLVLAVALGAADVASAQTAASQKLYNENCAACHQRTGLGVAGAAPALKGAPGLRGDPQALAAVVLFGRRGMPGFKDSLSDAALADIMTYVGSAWGNKARPLRAAQFAAARKAPRSGRPPPR